MKRENTKNIIQPNRALLADESRNHSNFDLLKTTNVGSFQGAAFIGYVETITKKQISGWCMNRHSDGNLHPCAIIIKFPNGIFIAEADLLRPDLKEKFGAAFGHFKVQLPDNLNGHLGSVFFGDGISPIPHIANIARHSVRGNVDEEHGTLFQGWATDERSAFTKIELAVNNEIVSHSIASQFRKDLAAQQINDGFAAFACKAPARVHGIGEVAIEVRANNIAIFSDTRRYAPLSVLIVSETENLTDASRYYRCDNLRALLRHEEVDSHVIGITEFSAKEWDTFDVIIFARAGASAELYEKVIRYKTLYGTKIYYEIDDLVFLPWHTFDLGSVRSGVDRADDPKLINMFSRRLRLLSLADGAITTTPKIKHHIEAMGIRCIQIPNLVKSHDMKSKIESEQGPLRLLCMSGSMTHYRDFEEIETVLEKLMRRHGSTVQLTLLGRFRPELKLATLPNVTIVDRVPYQKMLQMIDRSDLCLVPLERTEFNDAKSCLKFIECGARSVPIIASPTSDYQRAIEHGKTGFLAGDAAEWSNILETLVIDSSELRRMGVAANTIISEKYNLDTACFGIKKFIAGEIQ